MKTLYRSLALLMTVLMLFSSLAIGVCASEESVFIDTGQGTAEMAAAADDDIVTEDTAETTIVTIGSSEDDSSSGETGGGVIQVDDTTIIEYSPYEEDTRTEVLGEILSEILSGEETFEDDSQDETEMLEPDAELLETDSEATLFIRFSDAASSVSVQTDDGTTQTSTLYYLSDEDGQAYSLTPNDEAVEAQVETDEEGRATISLPVGTAVRLSAMDGYGHIIASARLTTVSGNEISGTDSNSFDFTISEDTVLTIETEEVGVNIEGDEDPVEGIRVLLQDGEFINDPTVTLPTDDAESDTPRAASISSSYWGTVTAVYEGGGTHPYPNGTSTGVFTVTYNNTKYTGICIDPSYAAPGSGSVGSAKTWNYYNVPLKDNPTFFAAIAASYYSNYGSTDNTIDYINLRSRTNWNQCGGYLYTHCGWESVVSNSTYGHGFAMYHELLGYLANGWSWDHSVLTISTMKNNIVKCCNSLYSYVNPDGSNFWQYAYNVLYTYRVFYYQSTSAGRQRIAWTVPRTDYGSVTIKKISSKTGEPLANCTITLTDVNDPNHKFTATTGEDGIATFEWVTWTTYTVEEVTPPEDYVISYVATDVAFTASFTYMSIEDDPASGKLEIVKLDHETATPLAGATFEIRDANGLVVATATTGDDGTITIDDLPYGDYTYQEIEAPPFYQLDDTVYSFTIEGGDTVTHTRDNCRIPGSISVLKSDANGKSVSGVTFLLQYSTDNGKTWQEVYARDDEDILTGGCTSTALKSGKLTTGTDGAVTFEGLRADGDILYRLTEVETQNGKTLLKDPVYEGTLPVDGDSDPVYDISISVTDGSTFKLPATGTNGYIAWLVLMNAAWAICLSVTLYTRKRFSRHYN